MLKIPTIHTCKNLGLLNSLLSDSPEYKYLIKSNTDSMFLILFRVVCLRSSVDSFQMSRQHRNTLDPFNRVSRTSAYDWNIYLEPQNSSHDGGKVSAKDQGLVLA